jgi:hypothetical protein
MLELNHPLNLQGLPTAKCSKHGNIAAPVPTRSPGKLTVVWTCPMCEDEDTASNAQPTLLDRPGRKIKPPQD